MSTTLTHAVEIESIVKKSRFLARLQAVEGRSDALAVVASLRRQHPGATHVCWALLAGGQSAANDDGEPSGTAGRPMLEVLRHHDMEGVLATVVRYFGGVKLGAGGLVRAYAGAVTQALQQAQSQGWVVTQVPWLSLVCRVPLALENAVRHCLLAHEVQLLQARREAELHLQLKVKASRHDAFIAAMGELARGQWVCQSLDPQ